MVIAGEIKGPHAFSGLKNQPSIQARSALEELLAERAFSTPIANPPWAGSAAGFRLMWRCGFALADLEVPGPTRACY